MLRVWLSPSPLWMPLTPNHINNTKTDIWGVDDNGTVYVWDQEDRVFDSLNNTEDFRFCIKSVAINSKGKACGIGWQGDIFVLSRHRLQMTSADYHTKVFPLPLPSSTSSLFSFFFLLPFRYGMIGTPDANPSTWACGVLKHRPNNKGKRSHSN